MANHLVPVVDAQVWMLVCWQVEVPEGVAEILQRVLNERKREEEGRSRAVAVQAGTHCFRSVPEGRLAVAY